MPSLADMLRPSMQTLKHIFVEINGEIVGINGEDGADDDRDPLFGIPSEFEDMRTNNNIETVTIKVDIDALSRGGGDNWCRLDKVFTTPGWVSLKRVSLAIGIISRLDCRENDELRGLMRKLPETQFPQLSSSNSISFDFEFEL